MSLAGPNLVAAPAAAHPHDLLQVTAPVTHDSFGPPPPPIPPPPNVGMRLVVSIPEQTLYVFDHGALVMTAPVSTGRKGHSTPVGTFQILQKKRFHRSNLYGNAPMPFMQRLTWGGVALHAGHVPGYPASHGCIRLPSGVAQQLYGMTDFETWVTVIREAPESPEAALALAAPFYWNASAAA
jgi:lipoprotein-anchoring transpeptidase ErfK/SrfK